MVPGSGILGSRISGSSGTVRNSSESFSVNGFAPKGSLRESRGGSGIFQSVRYPLGTQSGIAAIHRPDGYTEFVRTQDLKGWVLYSNAGRSGLYRMIPHAPGLTDVPSQGPVPKYEPEMEQGIRREINNEPRNNQGSPPSLAAILLPWVAVALLVALGLMVIFPAAESQAAQKRAPEGTFPNVDVVCTKGGIVTFEAGVGDYTVDTKSNGYIRFWYRDRNEWRSREARKRLRTVQ